MIGHQIKYEPAFASKEQRKIMESLDVKGNTKAIVGK
jgi:hypothetical protein